MINPFKPDTVIVLDKRGGILGAAPLSVAAARNDEDAVKSQMGLIASRRADLMMDYKVRNAPARESAAALKEHMMPCSVWRASSLTLSRMTGTRCPAPLCPRRGRVRRSILA